MALSQTLNLLSNQKTGREPLKDQTMKNTLLDIFAAVVIGLALCVGALAYFDVLTK